MDLIKLLDVSSPKNIKNVINTLIREYENVAENFPTKLSDLTDDETHRLVTDTEKASWNAKLSAIPNDYKTKTENDNLYQPKGNYLTSFTESDPTVPAHVKSITAGDINNWNSKQNAIDDLSTIRSGASLGTTAVQPNSLGTLASKNTVDYNTEVTNKPTIPSIEGLASETFVNTKAQEVLTTANRHTDDRISSLIGQAPETLDTLKEIADALAEDQTALDTLNLAIGNKVNKTLRINGKTLEQDINLTAADVGALSSYTETDPTVPAWAKAATKPSYNYSEINNTPTIPTVNNSTITIKQGAETKGTFTLNQSNASTIELDVGGGGGSNVTLYGSTGQNTDGAMTQKAVSDELTDLDTNLSWVQNSVLPLKAEKDGSNLNAEDISSWIEKLGLGLPLGTLIHSTKILKNAGLHLADGGELMIGGVYDDFCQYVINNQDEFPNILYDDEDLTVAGAKTALEKWQEEFATYGQCGYYVITDTYVKLPAITKLTGGLVSTEMYTMGTEAKPVLPNIRGYFTGTLNGSDGGTGKHEGAFYAYSTGSDSNSWGGNSGWNNTSTEGFDASRSNSIYSSKDRVEAEHIKYPYYIVVATVTKTDIEVNVDNIVSDLNNKIGKNECVRYPVEKWHSEDYSTWYTIYNDGFKEVGIKWAGSSSTGVNYRLPIPFSTKKYLTLLTVNGTSTTGTGGFSGNYPGIVIIDEQNIRIDKANNTYPISIKCEGY